MTLRIKACKFFEIKAEAKHLEVLWYSGDALRPRGSHFAWWAGAILDARLQRKADGAVIQFCKSRQHGQ